MTQAPRKVVFDGWCADCGEECRGEWIDFGIGSYEYWGQKGNDTRMAWVSSCCEAPVLNEEGSEVDPPEVDDAPGPEAYDRQLEIEFEESKP